MNNNYSLHIDASVLNEAQVYARLKGINLSAVIESFLAKWTREQSLDEKISKFPISAQVSSLAGRMSTSNPSADLEMRKEEYLKEKYAL